MIRVFAMRASAFSWPRFLAYMALLAAIAGFSLFFQRKPEAGPVALASRSELASSRDARFEILRFGAPVEEIRGQLRLAGLPSFLRKQKATGKFTGESESMEGAALDVSWNGRLVGRFVERLVAIDADRSKLYVAFIPADPASLRRLVAVLESRSDPVDLMRKVMIEHVRSSIEGDEFDLGVLQDNSFTSWLLPRIGGRSPPQTDNFPLSYADQELATVRRAYREERERAGARASQL